MFVRLPQRKDPIVSNKLVIVESPTKVKSISKYLGDEYTVMASVGHILSLIHI